MKHPHHITILLFSVLALSLTACGTREVSNPGARVEIVRVSPQEIREMYYAETGSLLPAKHDEWSVPQGDLFVRPHFNRPTLVRAIYDQPAHKLYLLRSANESTDLANAMRANSITSGMLAAK